MQDHTGRDWSRIAFWLVAATAGYNLLEGMVAIAAGITAGSVALVGFGFDSFIELAAASVLIWRMAEHGLEPAAVEQREATARRFVGATFFLLAAYVLIQSSWVLWTGAQPNESLVGIVLAFLSLTAMPLIAWGKFKAARRTDSRALAAEAKETLACSYLSFALLLGLGANALAGWWWADPAAALLMVPWLAKEGREAFDDQS